MSENRRFMLHFSGFTHFYFCLTAHKLKFGQTLKHFDMKPIKFICVLFAVVLLGSCQKELSETTNDVNPQKQRSTTVEPLVFSSVQDFQNTLYQISNNIEQGVSPELKPGFISYAETIMSEEESQDLLYSEVIGSVLNPEGEVIIGDYMMKLCKFGTLYSFKENAEQLRTFSAASLADLNIVKATSFPIYDVDSEEMNAMYEVVGFGGMYFYDIYGLLNPDDSQLSVETKAGWSEPADVHFAFSCQETGNFLETDYTRPNASQQKNKFPGGKVANDTKIYRRSVAGYKESGVKTKTMKKKGLIWQKFDCNNTSAITDLYIHELNWQAINHDGWLDINTTSYSGRDYVIATKVTTSVMNINMSNEALINECNDAIKWAKSKGMDISNVDGVRHIYKYDTRQTFVRIKDRIVSEYSDKVNAFYNLEAVGTLSNKKSSLGNLVINNMNYNVHKVSMYGYSEYEREKIGARVQYLR